MRTTATKRKVGRPSKYTPALGLAICQRLAAGHSLREICRQAEFPEPITIRMWLIEDKFPEFSAQYAQAREAQAEHYFDEMFEISDDGSNDWMERQKRDGTTDIVLNGEHVLRSRLRVDTRKWALARMSPKKYGAVAAGDAPGDVNVHVSLTMIDGLKQVASHRSNRLTDALATNGTNGHPQS